MGATLEDRPRYSVADCFETFPLPNIGDLQALELAGEAYYTFRSRLMADVEFRERQGMHNPHKLEGMTKVYNHFHNPSCQNKGIAQLRELHANMDREVARAYGWSDPNLEYEWIDRYSGLSLKERYQQLAGDQVHDKSTCKNLVKPRLSFIPSVRDQILSRLLELNVNRCSRESSSTDKSESQA